MVTKPSSIWKKGHNSLKSWSFFRAHQCAIWSFNLGLFKTWLPSEAHFWQSHIIFGSIALDVNDYQRGHICKKRRQMSSSLRCDVVKFSRHCSDVVIRQSDWLCAVRVWQLQLHIWVRWRSRAGQVNELEIMREAVAERWKMNCSTYIIKLCGLWSRVDTLQNNLCVAPQCGKRNIFIFNLFDKNF